MNWEFENNTWAGHLALNVSSQDAWMSIGIGTTMLEAEMIVCQRSKGTHLFRIAKGNGQYAVPPFVSSDIRGMTNTSDGQLTCQFEMNNVDSNQMSLIWAYSESEFIGHDNVGTLKAQLSKGIITQTTASTLRAKQIHGFGMMVIWLLIAPISLFITRYCLSIPGWLSFNTFLQLVSFISVFIFFSVIYLDFGMFLKRTHSYMGIVVLCLTGLMFVCSWFVLFGFTTELPRSFKKYISLTSKYGAYLLLLVADIQVLIGINTFYPWVLMGRGKTIWALWITANIFWPLVFIAAEYYWRRFNYKNQDKIMNALDLRYQKIHPIKRYTWEILNEEVDDNKALVVVKGLVYDIGGWLKSHPGGSLVLKQVIGTDITPDFFSLKVECNQDIIKRGRNVHEHSFLALQRLGSMHVGEMEANKFHRLEFKRYLITHSQAVSSDSFLVRFTILYPRSELPIFYPGQYLEIQTFFPEKIHRFYYPINGDINQFEVLVKQIPLGKMSNILTRNSELMYQIRGPFGKPILSPNALLLDGSWVPKHLLFFSFDQDLFHMLQLISFLFPLKPQEAQTLLKCYQSGDFIEADVFSQTLRLYPNDFYLHHFIKSNHLSHNRPGIVHTEELDVDFLCKEVEGIKGTKLAIISGSGMLTDHLIENLLNLGFDPSELKVV